MADGVVRGVLPANLKVSLALVTDTAREARARHHLERVSASLLAQGLVGGVLLASLQKGDSRTNLQLECDGPLKGFFVDAGSEGDCRGYAKNPTLDVELGEGPFRWRAALGNSGFLSVLRDLGTEYYRSSVELTAMDVAEDLNHYFTLSDQVLTKVAIEVRQVGDEPLGLVAGVLVQLLPDGDRQALEELSGRLASGLGLALAAQGTQGPGALFAHLFPGVPPMVEYPVAFRCSCSRERALKTIASLGKPEVQHIVDTMGSTAVTCHFCGTKHEVTLIDLLRLLDELGAEPPRS
jgi:molecular chaperone Hsp33